MFSGLVMFFFLVIVSAGKDMVGVKYMRAQFTCMDFPSSALRRVSISLSLSLTAACHLPVKTEAVLRRVSVHSKPREDFLV